MDNALIRIAELIDSYTAKRFKDLLKPIGQMKNGIRVLKRMASAPDKDQLEDYLAEVRYALVFSGLGFTVEIEPLGKKGPDFKVSRDGKDVFLEVTRFRSIHPGPPPADLDEEIPLLTEYGDPSRDIRKAIEKVVGKFRQIGNEAAIIGVWNDDGNMEEIEVEMALQSICTDAQAGTLPIPKGLLFVLYGSDW